MAINYAEKYSPLVDEKFKTNAKTNSVVNNNYDWVGVETVKVYSIPTVPLTNYTISGTNRFGTPAELQNTVQEMKLTRDRSFTFTIDMKSEQDTIGVMNAAKALRRQVEYEVIPEVDKYRIGVIQAAGTKTAGTVDKTNAYEAFLTVQEGLDDKLAPEMGRVCLATPEFINMLKLDPNYTKYGDSATSFSINKPVGMIDGVPVISVPKSYFSVANTYFVVTNGIATVAPQKLDLYRILTDVQGIAGAVVEGRVRYDAFVLNNKKDAIAYAAKA